MTEAKIQIMFGNEFCILLEINLITDLYKHKLMIDLTKCYPVNSNEILRSAAKESNFNRSLFLWCW